MCAYIIIIDISSILCEPFHFKGILSDIDMQYIVIVDVCDLR